MPNGGSGDRAKRYRPETARERWPWYIWMRAQKATNREWGRLAQGRRRAAMVAVGLAVGLVLAACSAGGEDGAAQGAPTTAAPTTATPTTEAPTTTQAPTTTEAPTTTAAPTTTTRPKPTQLRSGAEGEPVKALQRRLRELGYEVQEADGRFGPETHHAVVAFQKVNRLGRDGVVGPITRRALEGPRTPRPRSTKAGFHVEADLTLQVVYLVRDGRIQEILDASSASGQTYVVDGDVRLAVTPLGSFQIQRKIDAWRKSDLGLLYRPAYFIGGYALHGAHSVPPFPASHGCIRITTTAMDRWFARLPVGTPMLVYRS
jgi:Putative peptidoglycan binding domain/L,D-transpeptidase catalytic domain